MISECLDRKTSFGVVRAKEEGVAEIGCTAEIITVTRKYPDGRLDIVTEGRERFEVMQVNQERSFLQAEVLYLQDEPDKATVEEIAQALKLQAEIIELAGSTPAASRERGPTALFQSGRSPSTRSRFQADSAGDEVRSGTDASRHFLLRSHLAESAAHGAGAAEGRRQWPCALTRRQKAHEGATGLRAPLSVVYEFGMPAGTAKSGNGAIRQRRIIRAEAVSLGGFSS